MLGEGMCLRAGATIGSDTERKEDPAGILAGRRRLALGTLAFRNVDMSIRGKTTTIL